MAEQWTVIRAADAIGTDGTAWEIHVRCPDGSIFGHIFPKVIFEIRAAEYGIDPADLNTLLDVVLHEPHIPDATQPANHATDAAALAGHVTDDGAPTNLFNAATIAQARAAHLARVEACKKDRIHITSGTGPAAQDPLKVIRDAYKPNPARVAAIAEEVSRVRRAAQRPRPAAAPSRPLPPWHPDWSA